MALQVVSKNSSTSILNLRSSSYCLPIKAINLAAELGLRAAVVSFSFRRVLAVFVREIDGEVTLACALISGICGIIWQH